LEANVAVAVQNPRDAFTTALIPHCVSEKPTVAYRSQQINVDRKVFFYIIRRFFILLNTRVISHIYATFVYRTL